MVRIACGPSEMSASQIDAFKAELEKAKVEWKLLLAEMKEKAAAEEEKKEEGEKEIEEGGE